MSYETIRNIILLTGWPILATGSLLLFFNAYKFYLNVNRVVFGKLVLRMTTGWLITMYSLGIVSTLAMHLNVRLGVLVVSPIFLLWGVTITGLSVAVLAWTREAATINEFHQDTERKYQSIFELSPEAILLLDETGSVISTNERLYDWLGYSTKKIIGRDITGLPFIAPDSAMDLKQFFLKSLQGLAPAPLTIKFINNKGNIIYGRLIGSILKGKEGDPDRKLIMISNITAEVKLENQSG